MGRWDKHRISNQNGQDSDPGATRHCTSWVTLGKTVGLSVLPAVDGENIDLAVHYRDDSDGNKQGLARVTCCEVRVMMPRTQ